MDHFPELVYSTYVDGELPEARAAPGEGALAALRGLQRFVASLEAENRVLMQAFHETPSESAAAVRGIGRSLLLTALSAIVVAIGLDRVVVYAERIAPGVGSGANWFSLEWLAEPLLQQCVRLGSGRVLPCSTPWSPWLECWCWARSSSPCCATSRRATPCRWRCWPASC